ncbi:MULTISPECIES: C40 family peptidase [unclassified Bacillus (in: firmicutes)]|uniref:C40 family peptidase n=1 Tax=unclassified Bacillus (in: firmicutes) TaxID=185979 RepID=UPI0008F39C81|nr:MULTISPECIES: C40 family peptidase [unclassified Bacillus (in: firmicutes)]SFB06787.1 NlpC/P60 family protein [Bacillus sp. UNCCL13]SFQ87574.1 NlpC/P60 family protein [Bacillus sp. cl95]
MLKKFTAVLLLTMILGIMLPTMGEAATYHTTAISTAKKNIGVKYTWGGMSPSTGFDCSGLVKYSYSRAGKYLPRTAGEMWGVGTRVYTLVPGDLVFYKTYTSSKPTHVGIYIGNGQFIHSSSSKGVTISYLSNTYWKPRYVGAKRI